MVGILTVHGGRRLCGEVAISGAKNAVLPLLAATVATPGCYRLEHCPRLTDVDATIHILRHLGCRAEQDGATITVDSRTLDCRQIPQELMRRLRSSVIFLGALLVRCGQASMWLPGGCLIGARPIDLHLDSLRQLGARVELDGEQVYCTAQSLQGGTVSLPFPSVGATENLLLAGMGCPDGVTIENAAQEPEVTALARFLSEMGAEISGAGSSQLTLHPPKKAKDAAFSVLPDRIEAATYLCALAACGGELALTNIDPQLFAPVLQALSQAGVGLRLTEDSIYAVADRLHAIDPIETSPYPGFPTDAQAPLMAALLCAQGESVIRENIFEHRFRHVDALRAMGADIQIDGSTARIRGVKELHGASVASTDLRGGAAMVIAALSARGVSHITQIQHIFRGYDSLCEKLSALGADIRAGEDPLEDIQHE